MITASEKTIQWLIKPIAANVSGASSAEQLQRTLTAIESDSRRCRRGCLFVAYPGPVSDGHDYIQAAIAAGAIAVVCQRLPQSPDPEITWIQVADAVTALGVLASRWHGDPSRRLKLVGVTGTNGKTTIATLIYDTARLLGLKAGLISTVANKVDSETFPATNTTPGPLELNALLARMADAGCQVCAMEVSSHACHQKRIAGITYAGAIFTNLTRDHLDYHRTMDAYLRAKKSFFDSLGPDAWALTNADDRNGAVMLQNTAACAFSYGLRSAADFRGRMVEDSLDGMVLQLQGLPDGTLGAPAELSTAFTGRFNATNLTAVYAASLLLGWDRADVLCAMSSLRPVAGRMQTIACPGGVTAVVDYAHTPDALANVLQALAESSPAARIITVCGAGGDRDAGKRPLMAAEAVKGSSMVVITSDNPRHEDPAEIARQMLEGVPQPLMAKVKVELDRAAAIELALMLAQKGDAVLIAGKGHEDYQIVGDEKRHFDDCEQVRRCFGALEERLNR